MAFLGEPLIVVQVQPRGRRPREVRLRARPGQRTRTPSGSPECCEVLLADPAPQDGAQGVFILGTARPDWTPSEAVSRYGQYRPVELKPLSDEATRELVRELLQQVEGVPDEVVRLLVERSEGIPYYAEEMVNWFIDRGIIDQRRSHRVPDIEAPTSVAQAGLVPPHVSLQLVDGIDNRQ